MPSTARLDRTRPPALVPLAQPPFPKPQQGLLQNGLSFTLLSAGSQPLVEVQLVLEGGSLHEPSLGVANAALRMLQEGTARHSGARFAEALDALGASLHIAAGNHTTTLRLTVLRRHLAAALDLVQDVLLWPAFPEAAWTRLHGQLKQQMAQQAAKTQYHAQRLFFEALFPGHGYGATETAATVENLQLAELRAFWQSVVRPLNGFVLVAGAVAADEVVALLEAKFGVLQRPEQTLSATRAPVPHPPARLHHAMDGSVQCTLLVGHQGPPRATPDYYPLRLLSTVLGGYFGSRLMQHLREEKGYTYGIGGGFSGYRLGGYLGVRTDVGTAYLEPAIEAIRHEIGRLCTETMPVDELERARRYLLGRFIAGQETPFQQAGILKSLLVHGISLEAYRLGFAEVQQLSAEALRSLAEAYLHPDRLVVASAGGPEAV